MKYKRGTTLAYLQEKNNLIADARATLDSAIVYLPDNKDIINNRNKIISRMQVEEFAPLYTQAMQLYMQQRYAEAIPIFTKFLGKSTCSYRRAQVSCY